MVYQWIGWRKPEHPQGGGEEAWQLAQWTGWGLCGGLWGLLVKLGILRLVVMGGAWGLVVDVLMVRFGVMGFDVDCDDGEDKFGGGVGDCEDGGDGEVNGVWC